MINSGVSNTSSQFSYMKFDKRTIMQMKTLGLTLMMLSAALAGCTTGDETGTTDMDLLEAKINDFLHRGIGNHVFEVPNRI